MLEDRAEGSLAAATAPAARPAEERATRRSPFFTVMGLAMLVLAIAGFWPQYFSAAIGRSPEPTTRFWLIHLHAALFTGWLILYISQASLIFSGRTSTHTRLGPWFAGYGFVTAAVGLFAAVALAHRLGERLGDLEVAAGFVFFPLVDMLFFAGFLAAAIMLRRRPDLHRRAMVLATFSIAVVGLGRLVGRLPFESALIWQPLNLLPLLAVVAYDVVRHRRVYAIMLAGLAVHLLRLNAELFTQTEAWLPVGRALIAPFR